ncbi:TetR/AcrR family transcriptional regulator [Helicovermis profundi]|uniref:TetR/AcrR family transcriptional regulator n=1 Tax=Helicovermis profundi TaxID=3065157 RepID=A0AAU9ERA5_9FIRM|nr:TetR/AcrR family transcriptional regulator [Clostridia bacterium S502]
MNSKTKKTNQSKIILQAAFKCISTRGYANVSMREIADEAGVVLSQIHYYYKNKEGLFVEVIKLMMNDYLVEIEDHLKNGITPKEKISGLIIYFQEVLRGKPKLFRVLYDLSSMALWSETFSKLLSNLFSDVADLIDKYALNNITLKSNLSKYSSIAISRMIFGAMFGTAIQVILDPDEEKLPSALTSIELIFD